MYIGLINVADDAGNTTTFGAWLQRLETPIDDVSNYTVVSPSGHGILSPRYKLRQCYTTGVLAHAYVQEACQPAFSC